MSLYSRMKELRPLPNHEDYKGAFEITDESFGKDGSWGNVVAEFARVSKDETLKAQILTAAQYGYLLKESELSDEQFPTPVAKALAGRAFAQGFYQQIESQQLLFSNKFDRLQALTIMHHQYAVQDFEKFSNPQQVESFNSQYVSALGQYGLSLIGDEARAYVNTWALDAYPADQRLTRAFAYGHGAMILMGVKYQTGLNEQLLALGSREVNLDEEVASVLISSSGEDN